MRKALIIGNCNYSTPLNNPINDANLMNEILSYKGFIVSIFQDVNNIDFHKHIDSFCDSLNDGDNVIFYFAGHAVEDRDVNYLLSIDFNSINVCNDSVSLDMIQNKLCNNNPSGLKLIIVDACRNNPSLMETLSPKRINVNNNVLIAYSTSSGNTAKDGKNGNSIYTKSLTENIKNYNLSINDIFSKTRETVIKQTNYSQIPWEYSSLLESKNFIFDNIPYPNKLIRIIKNHLSKTYGMKRFNDQFIVVGDSNKLNLFKTSYSCVKTITLQKNDELGTIESVDFNNHFIIYATDTGCIIIYDLLRKSLQKIKLNHSIFTTLINKNNLAFFAGENQSIYIFNIKKKRIKRIKLKKEVLSDFHSDRKILNSLSKNITIMALSSPSYNPDIIAFGGSSGIFCIKNIKKGSYLLKTYKSNPFLYTYSICFSNDKKHIATGHEDGKCILWDAEKLTISNIFQENKKIEKNQFFEFTDEIHSNHICCIRFSPDSKLLAIATSESSIIFYDTTYYKLIHKVNLNIEPFPIYAMEFDEKGEYLAVAMNDKNYIFSCSTSQKDNT